MNIYEFIWLITKGETNRSISPKEPKVGWVFITTSQIIMLIITREYQSCCCSSVIVLCFAWPTVWESKSERVLCGSGESTQSRRKDGGLYIVLRTKNTCSGGVKYNVIFSATQPTITHTGSGKTGRKTGWGGTFSRGMLEIVLKKGNQGNWFEMKIFRDTYYK